MCLKNNIEEEKRVAQWLQKGIAPSFKEMSSCVSYFESLLCGFECSPHQEKFVGLK